MSCDICADLYTKVLRREIKCVGCEKSCCLRCFQTYIMDNPLQCMYPDCNKKLEIVEIRKIVTNLAFCKRLDDKLSIKLLEEEKSRLPHYQVFANIELEKIRFKKREKERLKKQNEISLEIVKYETWINTIHKDFMFMIREEKGKENKKIVEEKSIIAEKVKDAGEKISNLKIKIIMLNAESQSDRVKIGIGDVVKKEYTFVKQCSQKDCKGFLEKSWVCSVCDKYTCSKCHEPKTKKNDDKHVCDEDTIANLEIIKKDSKPCPKCGAGIFKVSGCFDENVEILMYDGSVKKVIDVKNGDELVGIDGTKRTVLKLCNGEDDMYEVKQTVGMNYKVNSKHTLLLKARGGEIVEMIVDKYIELPQKIKEGLFGFKFNRKDITSIEVEKIGKGKYYGFMVDEDNKFLLRDNTAVRNCDQMFCPMCMCVFDWKTMKIYTGKNIHNPDAFRYQREHGIMIRPTDQGNQECIDPISNNYQHWALTYAINYFDARLPHIDEKVLIMTQHSLNNLVRVAIHIQDVSIPNLQTDDIVIMRDLAVKYLMNKITEEDWLKELKAKIVKKTVFNREKIQIYGFFCQITSTILSNIMQLINTNSDYSEVLREFKIFLKMKDEVNTKFADLYEIFKQGRKTRIAVKNYNDGQTVNLDSE